MALELAGLVVLGLFVGAYGTIIGAGGGFILVPVLLLVYPDYEPEHLTAVSLAVVFASATSGSVAYGRQKRIDYVTGGIFAAGSLPGVLAGALVVEHVPTRVFSALFAVMLLVIAGFSIRGRRQAVREPIRGRGVLVRTVTDPEGRLYVYAYRIWQGIVLSIGVGFISSLFGIGGGVIHVPAMIMLLHIPVQYSVATSHFVLAFMSGGATLVHIFNGTLAGDQAVRAVALAAGAIPGAQLGALLAHRVKPRAVLLLLAGAIVLLGIRMLLKSIADI